MAIGAGASDQSRRMICVVDYDVAWPLTFMRLQAPIAEALAGIAVAIEHIGSTSVPGLAAKPIIDIDIVVPSHTELPAVMARLAALDYRHRGNLGIEDREAFDSPTQLPAHNLYACRQDSPALANHLAIRDYLRWSPAAAEEYGQLKKRLAARFPTDMESYVAGKTDFLVDALRRMGFSDTVLRTIREANRKK